ncbi:MAG: hypothetical protein R6X34_21395, partial [Chloroflexota bacterium]
PRQRTDKQNNLNVRPALRPPYQILLELFIFHVEFGEDFTGCRRPPSMKTSSRGILTALCAS